MARRAAQPRPPGGVEAADGGGGGGDGEAGGSVAGYDDARGETGGLRLRLGDADGCVWVTKLLYSLPGLSIVPPAHQSSALD